MEIYTLPESKSQLDKFMQFYDLHKVVTCPNAKPHLGSRTKRTCRFCHKSYKAKVTTFKKDAHIIPELLGNKGLVSNFECDDCNEKFSDHEHHLEKFIGPIRTILQTKGKKGTPKFKSQYINAQEVNILDQDGLIEITKGDINNDSIVVDGDNGKIRLKKKPYRPLKVYKAFLKMALGCLDKKDVVHFTQALNFLNRDTTFKSNFPIISLYKTNLPLSYNNETPFMLIFKKKHKWLNMPTFSFALYTMNYVYQFQPPFHNDDQFLFNKEQTLKSYFLPLISNRPWAQIPKYHNDIIQMSSNEIVTDDIEELVMEGLKKPSEITSIDLVNKTIKNSFGYSHDFSKIKGIILLPKGTAIKIPSDYTEIKNSMKSKPLKASPTVVLGILLIYTFIDYLNSDVKIDYRVWIALVLYSINIILYFFKFKYGVVFTGVVLLLAIFMIAKFLPTLLSQSLSIGDDDGSVSTPYLDIRMLLLLIFYIVINRSILKWRKS